MACIIARFADVLCALPPLCSADMIHCGAWRSTEQGQISRYGRIHVDPRPHLVCWVMARTYVPIIITATAALSF
jgi:hypothetical protein